MSRIAAPRPVSIRRATRSREFTDFSRLVASFSSFVSFPRTPSPRSTRWTTPSSDFVVFVRFVSVLCRLSSVLIAELAVLHHRAEQALAALDRASTSLRDAVTSTTLLTMSPPLCPTSCS
jgi:hypothetical protein